MHHEGEVHVADLVAWVFPGSRLNIDGRLSARGSSSRDASQPTSAAPAESSTGQTPMRPPKSEAEAAPEVDHFTGVVGEVEELRRSFQALFGYDRSNVLRLLSPAADELARHGVRLGAARGGARST